MDYQLKIPDSILAMAQLEPSPKTLTVSEKALRKHMHKHHHANCLDYVTRIPEMIAHPDFVGRNRRVDQPSFECIKCYRDNILLAIKLAKKEGHYYVASLYEVTDDKLESMQRSGRIRRLDSPSSRVVK